MEEIEKSETYNLCRLFWQSPAGIKAIKNRRVVVQDNSGSVTIIKPETYEEE